MSNRIDLAGRKYGKLMVIKDVGKKNILYWECLCECGNIKIMRSNDLKSAKMPSCGCYRKKLISDMASTHGLSKTPFYRIWINMKARCYSPNEIGYKNYGGRGIRVCDRWLKSFENFHSDVIEGYQPGMSFDRIDNNLSYEKNNVRWVTKAAQAKNKRCSVILTHNGVTLNACDWAKKLNLTRSALCSRIRKKWPIEKILSPKMRNRTHKYEN